MVVRPPYYGKFADYDNETLEELLEGKLSLMPGHTPNLSAATFILNDEDHTLGNVLRYMIMKDPDVEFCGYSMPHPSEQKVHLRIQMYDQKPATVALRKALNNLRDLFQALRDKYEVALDAEASDRTEEQPIDWEEIRRRKDENMRAGLLPGSQPTVPGR